jgi:hypothetical protein
MEWKEQNTPILKPHEACFGLLAQTLQHTATCAAVRLVQLQRNARNGIANKKT